MQIEINIFMRRKRKTQSIKMNKTVVKEEDPIPTGDQHPTVPRRCPADKTTRYLKETVLIIIVVGKEMGKTKNKESFWRTDKDVVLVLVSWLLARRYIDISVEHFPVTIITVGLLHHAHYDLKPSYL